MKHLVWVVLVLALSITVPDGVQGRTGQELLDRFRLCSPDLLGSVPEEVCRRRMEAARRKREAKEGWKRREAELNRLSEVASQLSLAASLGLHGTRETKRTWASPYPNICHTPQTCREKSKEMQADVRQAKKESWRQYQHEAGIPIPKESTIVEDYFKAKGWEQ